MKIGEVIHIALDTLFPPRCAGCKKIGSILCEVCILSARRLGNECLFCGLVSKTFNICSSCGQKFHIDGIFWPLRYHTKNTKKIVYAYKYGGKTGLAPTLASLMELELKKIPKEIKLYTIPIPLHPSKERERGFNQAKLLADFLNIQSIPVLVRTRDASPQARTSSRQERLKRLRGAFTLSKLDCVRGKDLLIVDDVATTGATLIEAARTLHNGGAGSIYAVVLAHG